MVPAADDAVLDTLSGDECRRLIGTLSVGRLGVVRGGFPLVFPVNYGLSDDRIVVRTVPGAKLSAARHNRVCFEVDQIDAQRRTGWSVLVQGFAVEIGEDDPRFADLARSAVEPWAPGDRTRLLLITPISVTGRRIRHATRPA